MSEPVEALPTFERREHFPVPPDVLWEAMTDPELLAEWFGPVDLDLEPGGAITDGGGDGGESRTIGVVETVEPPHRIGFVWIAPGSDVPSSVQLEIEPDVDAGDDGSVLHVREVRIEPRWEPRPAWFAPSACASAGSRA